MATKKTVKINPTFKWAVIINCILCFVCLIIMLIAAFFGQGNELAKNLFTTCEKVFTLTAGAFIGLLGGRAAAPDAQNGNP